MFIILVTTSSFDHEVIEYFYGSTNQSRILPAILQAKFSILRNLTLNLEEKKNCQ